MITCSVCGFSNPADHRFCGNCGSRLEVVCPRCGYLNAPGYRFCGRCGLPLTIGEDAAIVPERRLVSVVFADLVGFTGLTEARDAEEVRDLLTVYFDRSKDLIERFGGNVEKYVGDAVMGVWGATLAREDDAERAVRAGLELVDMVAKLGAEVGMPDLAVRAGVLSGEASVGPGGNETGMVVGDLVNTASRLQAAAEPGTVLVGESTYLLVKDAVRLVPVADLAVRGKVEPVRAWRAERVVAQRGGRNRAEAIEAPFIGRDDELRLLKDLLHATSKDQRARLVSVIGQAGLGTSRLIWELEKYVDGLVEEVYWHRGRTPSFGEGVTFWALADMVRTRAGIGEGDDPATARDRVANTVEQFITDPERQRWVEAHLAGLLGLAAVPDSERTEQFSAFRAFFEGMARDRTTALVFEDLHWADPGLLDFVEELTDWSRDHPILVLTVARPELLERRPGWGAGRRGFVSLHLGPLSDQAMTALVNGLVPGIPEGTAKLVVERSGGVPLYAVELVRKLIYDGDLIEEDGCYCVMTGDITDLAVPDTLQAVIGARLDQLDPEERNLLQDAAVLGTTFSSGALEAVSGLATSTLQQRLSSLVRGELIEMFGDGQMRGDYRFMQSLVREVAYGRLAREARRNRHLLAAQHFAAHDDLELAGVVSNHYLEAFRATPPGSEAEALRDQARSALRDAAKRAMALHSYEQSLSLAEQGLAIAREGERVELWQRAAKAADRLARFDLATDYAEHAYEWMVDHGVTNDRATAATVLGQVLNDNKEAARAIEVLESVVTLGTLGEDHAVVEAAAALARAYMLSFRHSEAIATSDAVLAASERLGMEPVTVDALITKGTSLGDMGRSFEARALLKEALAMSRQLGLTRSQARALNNLAYLLDEDDPMEAERAVLEGLAEARRLGDRLWLVGHIVSLSHTRVAQGRLAEARQLLEDPASTEVGGSYGVLVSISWAYLLGVVGERDAALARLEEAERLAAEIADPEVHTWVDETRAFFDLLSGDFTGAFRRWLATTQLREEAKPGTLPHLTFAALSTGDPASLEEVRKVAARSPRRTRTAEAVGWLLDAGDSALGGRPEEAVLQGDKAIRRFEEWNQVVPLVLTAVSVANLLPEAHVRRAALLTRARSEIADHGLVGLERLVEVVSSGQVQEV